MGEAYFLRAHYYYILVRLYGGVPLRLQPFEPGESTDIARNTVDEVYAQILSDCKNAVAMLPPKSSYGDSDRGRACKEAAMAMLADIYLTLAPNHREYYDEVVTLCNDIAAMGYDLTQCNYADNFDATINNGAESLSKYNTPEARNMTSGAVITSHPGCRLSWDLVIQVW